MNTTALPTGFATEIDGAPALVVGYLHSHPGHPARGTAVWAFAEADTEVMATGIIGGPLYALVSVRWATPVTTVDPDGTRVTRYVEGLPFCPTGTTWYLHPVALDPEAGAYALEPSRSYAASGRTAAVPAEARAIVDGWDFGGRDGTPATAAVHNFAI